MTQFGRRLAVVGIVMMGATMLLFGRDIERALQARCVGVLSLEVGKEATSDVVAVEPRRGCQVAVELRLRSASVADAGNARTPRYDFPFTCTTLDEIGGQPFTQRAALRWDDATRILRDESADASGGRAHVQHNLPEFREPLSGKLRVRATLAPDTKFGATVESAELKVYDNIVRPADEMVVAGLALLVGPALMVVGVALAIVGWARARRPPEEEPMAAPPLSE